MMCPANYIVVIIFHPQAEANYNCSETRDIHSIVDQQMCVLAYYLYFYETLFNAQ